ncbi:MAG: hypothetical protein XXXJIFNMEKO3_01145 [Candidatus Erwinia impunctatus]|nr:hypothetical protein XXXJIFNMEKO_01145 [Culicoides impunctatus]
MKASYREELESIQSNDLEEMLQRHFELRLKNTGIAADEFSINWKPLDSPTAAEYADIELKQAQTASAYATAGAIDGYDIRKKLAADKESSYYGLDMTDEEENQIPGEAGAVGGIPSGGNEGETAGVSSGSGNTLQPGYVATGATDDS